MMRMKRQKPAQTNAEFATRCICAHKITFAKIGSQRVIVFLKLTAFVSVLRRRASGAWRHPCRESSRDILRRSINFNLSWIESEKGFFRGRNPDKPELSTFDYG